MTAKQKNRGEIPDRYKWHTTDIYATDALWREEYESVLEGLKGLAEYQGRLTDAAAVSGCLALYNELACKTELVVSYAHLKHHEDMAEPACQSMKDQSVSCDVKLNAAAAFIEPELLAADESLLEELIASEPVYEHYIRDLLRTKEHVRSAEVEEVLANVGEVASAPSNIFAMIENADMRFGLVTDENGQEVELTQGRYISLLESKDRAVRENVFRTYYKAFIAQKNTFASTYSGSVKADIFFARMRNYPSSLDAALFQYNIPRAVCDSLVSEVNKALPSMHRYMELRKKRLGVDELHMYDLYTPIVKDSDSNTTYEEAQATVLKALAPLGEEYLAQIRHGFDNGWLDVYENRGKHGGAYSWGAYGIHPFVLLNFENKIDDMFTLAHELGHALHSCYTDSTQPYIYSGYAIFLAEVASTVNEALLTNYLLNTLTDKNQLAYITNLYLEQFRTTLFRQTMFAEFEMVTHDMAERDEPLTVENLSRVYRDLNIKYYGEGVIADEEIDMEWARIPHFYNAFYVYQYATGMSAALALSQGILTEGAPAVERYIEFLKSGASDYPINILKKAGVDMSTAGPVDSAMKIFAELVEKMENF